MEANSRIPQPRNMDILTEKDFKAIPSIRLKKSEDGSFLSHPIRRALKQDFLCYWGRDKIAICYFTQSNRAGTGRRQFYLREMKDFTLLKEIGGGTEGILVFSTPEARSLPKIFLKTKRGKGPPDEYKFKKKD